MFFLPFHSRRGQGHWTQIVAAILVVVVIIVSIIIYTTNVGQSQRTISQCAGIAGIDELQGSCQPKQSEASPCGSKQLLATASCPDDQVCCLG